MRPTWRPSTLYASTAGIATASPAAVMNTGRVVQGAYDEGIQKLMQKGDFMSDELSDEVRALLG